MIKGIYKKQILSPYENVKIWRLKNKEKRSAHNAVFVRLKNGTLKKKNCEVCGEKKVDAHHEDYSKLLDIVWLCKKHHVKADIDRRERLMLDTLCMEKYKCSHCKNFFDRKDVMINSLNQKGIQYYWCRGCNSERARKYRKTTKGVIV